ncbi:MAG TPA: vWA domain-containing protein [Fimbriiglobus sp.]|nr:vWA domain-containing protein [Fimbriiglobus sp.]
MVAELIAVAVVVVAAAAEVLHFWRVTRAAPLAFGPNRGMIALAAAAGVLRPAALGAVAWGLATLLILSPKSYKTGEVKENEYRHLVLVLDVSPSMQLEDAGPTGKQKRAERAADLIQSFFERVQAEKYKTTIVAFYTSAKPVVLDTTDREVVRNILVDLPMRHAFKSGETNIFAGLEEGAKIAKPWPPGTAVLMIVTDGDTVPATGMPKMPASIGHNVVIVGVGNPNTGKPISGHNSRQDVSTLRQTATRLSGVYHDGNDKMLSTELVSRVDERAAPMDKDKMGPREYALLAVGVGTAVLALLPALLTLIGTGWTPGRRKSQIPSTKFQTRNATDRAPAAF